MGTTSVKLFIVGCFSILGSIAAIVSTGLLISVKNVLKIYGKNNRIIQTNYGKRNTNINY